jgi:hypothetical protein
MAEGDCLSPLLDAIEHQEIIYASSHGVYDLRNDIGPLYPVPPNTIIIEIGDAGDMALTTIDPLLWELVQNRPLFMNLLRGTASEEDKAKYDKTFKAMYIYTPGDYLYKRTLLFEPENFTDNKWAFYRFELGVGPGGGGGGGKWRFPKDHGSIPLAEREMANLPTDAFLYGIKRKLYRVKHTNPRYGLRELGARLDSEGRVTTHGRNEEYSQFEFIRECSAEYGPQPRIYIFSACASFWGNAKHNLPAEVERSGLIGSQQRATALAKHACGIRTLSFREANNYPGGYLTGRELQLGRALEDAGGAEEGLRRRGTTKTPKASFVRSGLYEGEAKNAVTRREEEGTNQILMISGRPTRGAPARRNLEEDQLLLFIMDVNGNYKNILNFKNLGKPTPTFTLDEALQYRIDHPRIELFRNARRQDGTPIVIPFEPPKGNSPKKGMCDWLTGTCSRVGRFFGLGGRRTRRFKGKSKRTRKVKRTKRSP